MPIAFDSSASGHIALGTTLTYPHTCTGNNLILLVGAVVESSSDLVTGITYNNGSMTQISKVPGPSSDEYSYLYYLTAPTTGANNVVVSSGSQVEIFGISASYVGAKQSGQPDSFNAGSAASGSIILSTTVVGSNCWAVSYVEDDTGGAQTAGAGINVVRGSLQGRAIGDSDGTVAIGTVSHTWTPASGAQTMHIVSLAPVPAGAGASGGLTTKPQYWGA